MLQENEKCTFLFLSLWSNQIKTNVFNKNISQSQADSVDFFLNFGGEFNFYFGET